MKVVVVDHVEADVCRELYDELNHVLGNYQQQILTRPMEDTDSAPNFWAVDKVVGILSIIVTIGWGWIVPSKNQDEKTIVHSHIRI